jgi:hypothetical protein
LLFSLRAASGHTSGQMHCPSWVLFDRMAVGGITATSAAPRKRKSDQHLGVGIDWSWRLMMLAGA